jgi:hypothetical protein
MIFKYKELNDPKSIFAFDFDDTLANSPDFNKLSIDYLRESNDIEKLLKKSVSLIGANINDLKWNHGKIFINDPDQKLNVKGNWVRKGDRVCLNQPDEFSLLDISIPTNLNWPSDIYKQCLNKCIITARPQKSEPKIKKCIQDLGLELPNFGLYTCPPNIKTTTPKWKADTLSEIIKDNKFENVYFWDDKPKIVRQIRNDISNNFDVSLKVFKV